MRSRLNYPVHVLAAGFLVLVFLSLSLFWASWQCKSSLADIMPLDSRSVDISLTGLDLGPYIDDPNLAQPSTVHAHIIHPEAPQTLGIADYFSSRIPEGRHWRIWYPYPSGPDSTWVYLDERTGQIDCRWIDVERMPDGTRKQKLVQFYVGPEGVSEVPDKKLGRFLSVVSDLSEGILYDRNLRRFFRIDLAERKIAKGPQLSNDDPHRPVDIGLLSKNPSILDLYWLPLVDRVSQNDEEQAFYSRLVRSPIRETDSDYQPERYVLVLDESGRIDLLDEETLEFTGTAGYLPVPRTLFPINKQATPADLLAYRVLPAALKEDHKYRGLFVAGVSREGTALALSVFDEKGFLVRSYGTMAKTSRGSRTVPSSSAVFFSVPWAPVATIGKYVLENLHPPILSLASYLTADSIEAASGHRAMFVLPNSFIAMKGRDSRGNIVERFLEALLLISPSMLFSIWLALRVRKDAAVVGLSRRTGRWWILGTIAFGLAGYITYRLTRPKMTLVTCANCGNPRRPDMDKCHHCGGQWHISELTPPAWRVLDGAEPEAD
ncbi:MAG: hypothetical protein JSW66_15135 [Phycisphaerales bacterium]|nr:MAG: hypothetical protein JSW66_15135 [Phycisphaerales bacterium]